MAFELKCPGCFRQRRRLRTLALTVAPFSFFRYTQKKNLGLGSTRNKTIFGYEKTKKIKPLKIYLIHKLLSVIIAYFDKHKKYVYLLFGLN